MPSGIQSGVILVTVCCPLGVVQFKVMQNLKLKQIFFLFLIVILAMATASAETLISPGGNIELSFNIKDSGGWQSCPVYEVSWNGKPVIAESRLGFDLQGGDSLADQFELIGIEKGGVR